jgi:transcriptional regulator with XRE-family HTH domain
VKKSNVTPNGVELNVAKRIASLRKDSSMTLKTLGELTGLSDAYLSRVENGKTAISIGNLGKVALALGVQVGVFFESASQSQPFILKRAGEGKRIRFRSRQGIQGRLLAENKENKLMEPIWLDVAAAKVEMPLQSHSGQEFMYIVNGKCTFRYGKEQIELREGDSIYFDSDVDHAAIAIVGEPCEAITVVTSRDYHFHGNIVRLLDE